jgi:aldose 1-epimerase
MGVPKMHPEQQLSIARNSEGATSMAVISQVGGALQKLTLNGLAIINSELVSNPAAMFFGSVLAPWPNRLANHSYSYSQQHYQTPNVDSDGNSNHGLIFNRPLEVKNLSEDAVTFGYRFGLDESYPFEIELEITYLMIDSGLKVIAAATNHGHSAPFGLGFHPYFSVGQNFMASARFTKQILVNEKMIPVSDRPIDGLSYSGGLMDDCFAGAQQVTLETEKYKLIISLDKGFEYFMLYRPATDC